MDRILLRFALSLYSKIFAFASTCVRNINFLKSGSNASSIHQRNTNGNQIPFVAALTQKRASDLLI